MACNMQGTLAPGVARVATRQPQSRLRRLAGMAVGRASRGTGPVSGKALFQLWSLPGGADASVGKRKGRVDGLASSAADITDRATPISIRPASMGGDETTRKRTAATRGPRVPAGGATANPQRHAAALLRAAASLGRRTEVADGTWARGGAAAGNPRRRATVSLSVLAASGCGMPSGRPAGLGAPVPTVPRRLRSPIKRARTDAAPAAPWPGDAMSAHPRGLAAASRSALPAACCGLCPPEYGSPAVCARVFRPGVDPLAAADVDGGVISPPSGRAAALAASDCLPPLVVLQDEVSGEERVQQLYGGRLDWAAVKEMFGARMVEIVGMENPGIFPLGHDLMGLTRHEFVAGQVIHVIVQKPYS